jgi:hypothetical protein
MQLRLLKRLLRLDTHRSVPTPSYQYHFPLGLVVDSHNPHYTPHLPTPPAAAPPLMEWWRAFGGEITPQN